MPAEPTTRWEIRTRHGPALMTTTTQSEADAYDYYAREVAGLDPHNRVELVLVTENIMHSKGPGPDIDPWRAIQLPFLKPGDYARIAKGDRNRGS